MTSLEDDPGAPALAPPSGNDGTFGARLSLPWWEVTGRIAIGVFLTVSGIAGTGFIWPALRHAGSGAAWVAPGIVAGVYALVMLAAGLGAAAGRMGLALAIVVVNVVFSLAFPILFQAPEIAASFTRHGYLSFFWGCSLEVVMLLWLLARRRDRQGRGRRFLQAMSVLLALLFLTRLPVDAALWGEQMGSSLAGPPAAVVSVSPGQRVPRLAFTDLQGKEVRLDDPDTLYVVDFWASWCGPCRAEMPALLAMARKYADAGAVKILAVNTETLPPEQVEHEAGKFGLKPGETYLDPKSWYDDLGLETIPLTLLIRKGEVVYRSDGYGPGTIAAIETAIREHVKAPAAAPRPDSS